MVIQSHVEKHNSNEVKGRPLLGKVDETLDSGFRHRPLRAYV